MHWGVSAATAIVCTNLVHSAFNGIIWLYRFGSPASRTCLQQCLVTLDKFDTLKVVLKAKHHPLGTGLRRVVYPFIIHLGRSRSLGAAACIFGCIRLYGFGPTQCGELSCLIESQSLHWHRNTDTEIGEQTRLQCFFFIGGGFGTHGTKLPERCWSPPPPLSTIHCALLGCGHPLYEFLNTPLVGTQQRRI